MGKEGRHWQKNRRLSDNLVTALVRTLPLHLMCALEHHSLYWKGIQTSLCLASMLPITTLQLSASSVQGIGMALEINYWCEISFKMLKTVFNLNSKVCVEMSTRVGIDLLLQGAIWSQERSACSRGNKQFALDVNGTAQASGPQYTQHTHRAGEGLGDKDTRVAMQDYCLAKLLCYFSLLYTHTHT